MNTNKALGFMVLLLLSFVLAGCGGGSGGDGNNDDGGGGGGSGGGGTDTLSPMVVSTVPADGATAVGRNVILNATFSEDMLETTINGGSFTLTGSTGTVTGTLSYNSTTKTAFLVPDAPLEQGASYTASLAATITDLAGNALTPLSWGFTVSNRRWATPVSIGSASVDPFNLPVKTDAAIDANGNIIAVWERDGDIWANRYDVGNGWGTAVAVESDSNVYAFSPQLAVAPNGNAIVVWEQTEYNAQSNNYYQHVLAGFYTPGSGWGLPEYLETETALDAYEPHVDFDSSGNAMVVWVQYDDINLDSDVWANRYEAGSGRWQGAELVDGDTATAANPQLAFDVSGNAMVVWWDSLPNSGSAIWARRYDANTGWQASSDSLASHASETLSDPRVGFDGSGNALVVWQQFDSAAWTFSIWANHYVVGNGWNGAMALEQDTVGSHSAPSLAVNASGEAMAVWTYNDRTIAGIQASRYVAGSGWSTPENINARIGNADTSQVAMDATGNAVVVWAEGDTNGWLSAWSNRYEIGSGWGTAELLENDPGDVSWLPKVVMNASNGSAMAVWAQDGSVWANRLE